MERAHFMRRVAKGVLAAAFLLSYAPGIHAGENHALLIGLNEYRSISDVVQLKYAVNDVDALSQQLTTAGYKVQRLTNGDAKRGDILAELQRYAVMLKKQDTFLLFFAGPGVLRPWGADHAYWLTYDAELSFLDGAGIRLTHLLEYVEDIPAERKLVLLDHCFSGRIGQRAGSRPGTAPVEIAPSGSSPADGAGPGSVSRGPAAGSFELTRSPLPRTVLASQLAPPRGTVVLTAAGNEAYELERLKHGVFTEALLLALRSREASGGKESLSLEQLSSFVRRKVRELSNDKQEFSERVSDGFRLADWILIDKLPIGNIEEAKNKRKQYLDRLNTWERERHIGLQAVVYCDEALTALVKSIENNARMDPKDEQIVALIGRVMDLAGSPATIGPLLESRVAEIRQAQ
jgi:hypothetical protein